MFSNEEVVAQLMELTLFEQISQITPEQAGYSNYTFSFIADGEKYIGKYIGKNTNQSIEAQVCQIAYQQGIAPKVIYADNNWIILAFIEGQLINDAKLSIDDKLEQLLAPVIELHKVEQTSLPNLTKLDIKQVIGQLLIKIKDVVPQLYQQVKVDIDTYISNISTCSDNLVVVHGDANFNNAIIEQNSSRVFLIDYEACSLAEREYELAMILAVNELSALYVRPIIEKYLQLAGNSLCISWEMVTRYYIVSLVINALWYMCEYSANQLPSYLEKANKQLAILSSITGTQYLSID